MHCPDCYRSLRDEDKPKMREFAVIGHVRLVQCDFCKRVESEAMITMITGHPTKGVTALVAVAL